MTMAESVMMDSIRKIMMISKLASMAFIGVVSWNAFNIIHGVASASSPEAIILNIDDDHVILFDGECNLCNKFVDMIIHYDSDKIFKFHPIQGESGKPFMRRLGRDSEDLSTIIYIRKMYPDLFHPKNAVYTKADAILQIAEDLKFSSTVVAVASACFPSIIRNYLYDIVVSNRYEWFGKRDECRCSL